MAKGESSRGRIGSLKPRNDVLGAPNERDQQGPSNGLTDFQQIKPSTSNADFTQQTPDHKSGDFKFNPGGMG